MSKNEFGNFLIVFLFGILLLFVGVGLGYNMNGGSTSPVEHHLPEYEISTTVITREAIGAIVDRKEVLLESTEGSHYFWHYKVYFSEAKMSKWFWQKDIRRFGPRIFKDPEINLENLLGKENRTT